jgi:type IX secretion system PorP/SprF family membrane protein
MFRVFRVLMISLSLFCFRQMNAQNYPVYNSFMINPYLYNPAEAASDYAFIFFNHRQQWMGIDGAPVLSTISFNTLIDESYTGIGAKASNFSRGILRTTDFALTYAHGIPFSDNTVLFLGLSGGMITSSIDFTKISADDLDDPALTAYLANNIQPAASFGLLLRSTSGINFGIVLPQLFAPAFNSASHFSATELTPFDNVYVSLYYRRKVEGKIVNRKHGGVRARVRTSGGYAPLELYAIYKYTSFGTNQFEVTGKFNFSENFWLGAGYRQSYGLTGHIGFSFDKFLISYSYEPGNQPETGFSTGTHEIQLGLRLGDEKHYRKTNPLLRSTLRTIPEERHQARFSGSQLDPEKEKENQNSSKKTYYVVLKAFNDFNAADVYKKRIIEQKFNADVFYYEKEKKFYVYVLSTQKSGEAYDEAKNLKNYTKLKDASVIAVQGAK